MKFNYSKICQELLKELPPRQKEVLRRRFALKVSASSRGRLRGETLESIGQTFGICRERVRQIERDGLLKIKPKIKKYQKIFQYFIHYLKSYGDFKKEDILLTELGGERWKSQVYFLLTLDSRFERFGESEDFYSLWTINRNSLKVAQEFINDLCQKLARLGKPLTLKELSSFISLDERVLKSYLEISKKIQKNSEGLFGLRDWPEINPRGAGDKAYLVFKKLKTPLHFRKVAEFIEGVLPQTVHNELIRDERFVLVGRGIYALSEWGYYPGRVRDIILKILQDEGRPLTKEEILEKVLKQRLVKENTVFLNLSNKKYFLKNSEGKYQIREI